MKYFEFVNKTKLIAGKHALEQLNYQCQQYCMTYPLILTDEVLIEVSVYSQCIKHLSLPYITYSHIPVDSFIHIVQDIVNLYKDNNCNGIIAIGGGSVLDTAKGVYLMLSQEVSSFENIIGFENLKKGKDIPFFAIPTTSGTGSEATSVAVISNPDKGIKMEIISEFMQFDVAFIDPKTTLNLPLKTTASCAIDALTHAIEAYTCSGKNPVSDVYAITAIKLIVENIYQVIHDPKDKEARLALAVASYNAGCAFSNSMVGIVHGIGHALGAVCHIPHGDAMSMLLVPSMKFNKDQCKDLYGELLLYIGGSELYARTSKEKRADKTIECIETLLHQLHIITKLPISLLSIDDLKNYIDEIIEKAMNDGAMIVNEKYVDYQDVIDILGGYYGY